MMTYADWKAEVRRRIGINEGCRLEMYYDTVGVPTIAYGYNLQRGTGPLIAAGITNPNAVCSGIAGITQQQADSLFDYDLPTYISYARKSLNPGLFDSLTDARRFVIVDLCYNLGEGGWLGFSNTRALINQAQSAKISGKANAHDLFQQAHDHLVNSAWYTQVGNRAKRNVAMLLQGVWCDPTGDGSDILS